MRPGLLADWLGGTLGAQDRMLMLSLRAPRALSAFAVGGLLALAGVMMQVLLRNPLADPYILGTSGGAATAALIAMLAGGTALAVDVAAFAGASVATALVFGLARGDDSWTPTRLLLTGVVLAAGFSAAISLLLALSPEQNLRGMLFWLMGDFSFAYEPAGILAVLALATALASLGARQLNILARGELQAAILGLAVVPARVVVLLFASALTAIAVTQAGAIGFVGLVVPHLVRQAAGSDHRTLIPTAVLAGGALLVVADTLARAVLAPRQLPVGALTAFIGVPLFLYLLRRRIRTG